MHREDVSSLLYTGRCIRGLEIDRYCEISIIDRHSPATYCHSDCFIVIIFIHTVNGSDLLSDICHDTPWLVHFMKRKVSRDKNRCVYIVYLSHTTVLIAIVAMKTMRACNWSAHFVYVRIIRIRETKKSNKAIKKMNENEPFRIIISYHCSNGPYVCVNENNGNRMCFVSYLSCRH